jgi:nitroreductase
MTGSYEKRTRMNYDDLMSLLKARRTVRDIKTDSIPDEVVEKVLEAARWAPSGFNMQPWEFLVVRDPELRNGIIEIVNDYRMNEFFMYERTREDWQGPKWEPDEIFKMINTPVQILILGDKRIEVGLPMCARYTDQKRISIFESSLANAFMYMQLAATTLGLGSFWVSAVKMPTVNARLRELLGEIPMYLEIYDMFCMGYPNTMPGPKLFRKKAEMVHYDYCRPGTFRTDEQTMEWVNRNRLDAIRHVEHM